MKKRRRPRKLRKKIREGKVPINGNKTTDVHHLCWPRSKWDNGWARKVRNFWYCKIEIPKFTLHAAIHQAMSGIPVPNGEQAKHALEELERLEREEKISPKDDIETRLRLLNNLFSETTTGNGFAEQLRITHEYRSH